MKVKVERIKQRKSNQDMRQGWGVKIMSRKERREFVDFKNCLNWRQEELSSVFSVDKKKSRFKRQWNSRVKIFYDDRQFEFN